MNRRIKLPTVISPNFTTDDIIFDTTQLSNEEYQSQFDEDSYYDTYFDIRLELTRSGIDKLLDVLYDYGLNYDDIVGVIWVTFGIEEDGIEMVDGFLIELNGYFDEYVGADDKSMESIKSVIYDSFVDENEFAKFVLSNI